MGNIVQNMQKKLSSSDNEIPTPEIMELTPTEIQLIQSTWAIPAAKPFDSGEKVLYLYFERYPHNQDKFQAFRHTPLLMLKGTPGFRAHASKIVNIFSSVVDALDKDPDMSGVKKIIAEVGRSHQRKHITKKALVELRDILVDVLSDVCHLDDAGKFAWIKLLDTMYNILFECLDGRSQQFD